MIAPERKDYPQRCPLLFPDGSAASGDIHKSSSLSLGIV